MDDQVKSRAIDLLESRGAREIPHPGGSLLAHLVRVHAVLGEWGARPAVRMAGLCHAFYGTDGFGTALGDVAGRRDLAAVTGPEVERLVYLYASCGRSFSYRRLPDEDGPFKDRFSGAVIRPPFSERCDFAEVTAANELDIVRVNADMRAKYGPALLDLFTSWRSLLSPAAFRSVRATLA